MHTTVTIGQRAQFRSQRIFFHASLETGTSGWCFEVRGGRVYGPFQTREVAERILNGLIAAFKSAGNTGGRDSRSDSHSLEPNRAAA